MLSLLPLKNLDHFQIQINRSFPPWSYEIGLLTAEIFINQRSLVEIVREVEEPFVRSEIETRRAAGENLSDADFAAGDYLALPPSLILRPSRNLLDEPIDCGFSLPDTDPSAGKATVLGCTCGVRECWFLQVRITLSESTVEWSDFSQFHRDWSYNLGSFQFERQQYEFELRPLSDR